MSDVADRIEEAGQRGEEQIAEHRQCTTCRHAMDVPYLGIHGESTAILLCRHPAALSRVDGRAFLLCEVLRQEATPPEFMKWRFPDGFGLNCRNWEDKGKPSAWTQRQRQEHPGE